LKVIVVVVQVGAVTPSLYRVRHCNFLPTKNGKEIKHILKDNGKEINQELHTIPLLSRTLQFSAHQEWEGNKPRMVYFRKVWMSSKFAGSDGEQVQFVKDFEELAD